ncbi:signal protein [Actinomadura barringtoniae]|uniref:Signal protein n=1 Tax=Actinomadura barringtoniae TaxID=1427535 RepID=A0A939PBR8_9ACTN|nr:signal protein [Actinomadura barringtoniae]MBO2449715.1 signal protein [Actinomadura barringtoniae]
MIRRFAPFICLVLLASACGGNSGSDATTPTTGSAAPSTSASPAAQPTQQQQQQLDPAEVQGAWWTWASSAPHGRNPVEDRTGKHCGVGQKDQIWFLAGTFGGAAKRRCTVPAGRTLVAPLVNLVGQTKKDCSAFLKGASGKLTADGKAARTLRWNAVPIEFDAVDDNPVSTGAGSLGGYGCGLWASVRPLTPGKHKISIRGRTGRFRVMVDYALTVSAG